jgi:hypothetical protein
MRCLLSSASKRLATATLLMVVGFGSGSVTARAGDKPKSVAMISLSADGPSPFVLSGNALHFGKFTCHGELIFQRGESEGSLDGIGVAALEAANGDLIVGVVTCHLDAGGASQVHFSWRDSVEFSDGTTVSNTGRFLKNRPAGVVIAIIAILIG